MKSAAALDGRRYESASEVLRDLAAARDELARMVVLRNAAKSGLCGRDSDIDFERAQWAEYRANGEAHIEHLRLRCERLEATLRNVIRMASRRVSPGTDDYKSLLLAAKLADGGGPA